MKTSRQILRIPSQGFHLGTLCDALLHKAEPNATVSAGDEDALVLEGAWIIHRVDVEVALVVVFLGLCKPRGLGGMRRFVNGLFAPWECYNLWTFSTSACEGEGRPPGLPLSTLRMPSRLLLLQSDGTRWNSACLGRGGDVPAAQILGWVAAMVLPQNRGSVLVRRMNSGR